MRNRVCLTPEYVVHMLHETPEVSFSFTLQWDEEYLTRLVVRIK